MDISDVAIWEECVPPKVPMLPVEKAGTILENIRHGPVMFYDANEMSHIVRIYRGGLQARLGPFHEQQPREKYPPW